jgi:hypothetical protein
LTRLKIAVAAPIPTASVSAAINVKPGVFSSERTANLRSESIGSPMAAQSRHRKHVACQPFDASTTH